MSFLKKLPLLDKKIYANKFYLNYFKVVFLWCPVATFFFILSFGDFNRFSFRFFTSMIISSTVASFCFFGGYSLRFVQNFYRAKYGLEPKNRNPIHGLLMSYPFLIPGLYFGFLFAGKYSTLLGYNWSPPRFDDYRTGVIFGVFVSGLSILFEVVRDSKEAKQAAEIRYQSLENENLKAQISALTAQMNPHLLFNSLNTIASTISSNPTSAESMTVQLSELYRGILKSAKGDMHSLENELYLCTSYLEIEKKRFGPRISYEVLLADNIDTQKIFLPVLLLQPLVENAIKHGLAPKLEGGRVSISVKKEAPHFVLSVVDNGGDLRMNKNSSGTGSGLANCEARLKLKYGSEAQFIFLNENGQSRATLWVPIKGTLRD